MIILKVLLMILKILGIAILSIIGTLLVLIVLALVLPLKYNVSFDYKEKNIDLVAKLSYFFRIFRVEFLMNSENKRLKIKILWFELGNKKPKKTKKTKKAKNQKINTGADNPDENNNPVQIVNETNDSKIDISNNQTETQDTQSDKKQDVSLKEQEDTKASKTQIAENASGTNKKDDAVYTHEKEISSDTHKEDITVDTHKKEITSGTHEKESTSDVKKSEGVKKPGDKGKTKNQNKPEKKASVSEKIKNVTDFLKENKPAFSIIYRKLIRLFRHILPGSHRIDIKLGIEDPASLGEIMGAIAIFRSATNFVINFTPYFNDNVIEVQSKFKGKIRPITILFIGLSAYFNKSVKALIKKIRNR